LGPEGGLLTTVLGKEGGEKRMTATTRC